MLKWRGIFATCVITTKAYLAERSITELTLRYLLKIWFSYNYRVYTILGIYFRVMEKGTMVQEDKKNLSN